MSRPWPDAPPRDRDRAAYAEAAPQPLWLDRADRPEPRPALETDASCDLAIVGGGLSGLWAAVQAAERDPGRDVVVLEGTRLAQAASGRNGGFLSSSLTHGTGNGAARFPGEIEALERLGLELFTETLAAVDAYGIDCDLARCGDISVALEAHELDWLAADAELLAGLGHRVTLLDRDATRARLNSPTYVGGLAQESGSALVDPAKLTWGLAERAEALGVRIHERTPVAGLRAARRARGPVVMNCEALDGGRSEVRGPRLQARRVLLATSAFPGLVAPIRRRVVPVWDYVLATEPLSRDQLDSIGWSGREGVSDAANQFHYYRLTADDRIVWGGYDAIYRFGGRIDRRHEQRDQTFALLAQHFFTTFPQLEGLRFSHRWGGAIDTCSRFFAFQGTTDSGRVAYTVGHTGLGVGASRFGARVALDLLDGRPAVAAGLAAPTAHPVPFPPEPLRWAGIELTRAELARSDRSGGRRGTWLRALDALGLGFDS